MAPSMRLPAAIFAGVLVIGAVGSPPPAVHGASSHPKTVTVSIIRDRRFVGAYRPRSVVVHRGQRILFRNVSNAPHTVSANNGSFDSGTIEVGRSWTVTARKIGTFTYFCQFHAGMAGTIVVKP